VLHDRFSRVGPDPNAPEEVKKKKAPGISKCRQPPIGCGKVIGVIKNIVVRQRYKEGGLCKECQDKVYKK
jgi:hypothetical protein